MDDVKSRLQTLKDLVEEGLITPEEAAAERKQVLADMKGGGRDGHAVAAPSTTGTTPLAAHSAGKAPQGTAGLERRAARRCGPCRTQWVPMSPGSARGPVKCPICASELERETEIDVESGLARKSFHISESEAYRESLTKIASTSYLPAGLFENLGLQLTPVHVLCASSEYSYSGSWSVLAGLDYEIRVKGQNDLFSTKKGTEEQWTPMSSSTQGEVDIKLCLCDGLTQAELDLIGEAASVDGSSSELAVDADFMQVAAPDKAAQLGSDRGRSLVEAHVRDKVITKIPTPKYTNLNLDIQSKLVGQQLVLHPLWIVRYEYGGKVHRLIIDGLSGKIAGDIPIDAARKAAAETPSGGTTLLAIIGLCFFFGPFCGKAIDTSARTPLVILGAVMLVIAVVSMSKQKREATSVEEQAREARLKTIR
jgi:hypothetical protein